MMIRNNTQDYFWTPEWQEAEKEADEDIKAGRALRFSNADTLIKELQTDDYIWINEGGK